MEIEEIKVDKSWEMDLALTVNSYFMVSLCYLKYLIYMFLTVSSKNMIFENISILGNSKSQSPKLKFNISFYR